MKLFVSQSDSFELNLHVFLGPNGRVLCADTAEHLNELAKSLKTTVKDAEEHTIVFRQPSAKDNAFIIDSSIAVVDGQLTFKSSALRLARITQLIVSWTFKEGDKPVPVTAEAIGELHPDLFTYISEELEKLLGLS